jgi:NADPH-dependent 2,4-dienoyl-CoA reductase/sulfur reductase-like enzyme
MGMSLAHNVWAAEAVKKEVKIPVIASGSINLPELAESILADGKGDFIGLGRPLWADPQWPLKAMEDRPEDIRPCIRCNDGCLARGDHQAKTISCSVNVAVCRENEFQITKAEHSKNVAVIGGGPAGMEAARVCALRGHHVTLYEKRELGGALIEASIPEFKSPDLKPLINYLRTQIRKLKIKVINEEATLPIIKSGGFDAVIVAAGATPLIPEDVQGINSPRVTSAFQVLQGKVKLGQKIAVIGGGIVGTEVGLFLAEQGKEVVFVEMLDTFMNNITFDEKLVYEERFKNLKISVHTGKRLERVEDKGITVIDRYGTRMVITADNVVLAAGFRSNRDLIDGLRNELKLQVLEVGDCVRPRKIFDAIHDGHLAAKLLN